MMKDKLVIAEAMNGSVRIRAARTTDLVEEARKCHGLYPTSCAALGRVLTVDAIMASEMKDPDARTVVTINGHGEAGTIVAQADGAGNVRGFIGNPQLYYVNEATGKLDVGRIVGTEGTLVVTKDLGLKEPFTGVVNLRSGEIGDDFAYYFAISEQLPSVVSVGVLIGTDAAVQAAGGMIIQLLPGASEEAFDRVEAIAKAMKPISTYIDEGKLPEEIIRLLFEDANILEEREIRWHCGCSKEHFLDAMALISEADLIRILEEDHGAEITCQYCSTTYTFSEEEVRSALEKHRNVENRERFNR